MNWNSKRKDFTPLVGERTKELAYECKYLRNNLGISIKEIAELKNLSKTRIYELLK